MCIVMHLQTFVNRGIAPLRAGSPCVITAEAKALYLSSLLGPNIGGGLGIGRAKAAGELPFIDPVKLMR